MTTLRIVKTTFDIRSIHGGEYAVCRTTLRIVKTTFDIRSIHGGEYAVCRTTLRIGKTIFIHSVFTICNEP